MVDWPIFCFLQEVKINPDDKATIHAVERAVRKQATEPPEAQDYQAFFCLPNDKHNARGFGRKVYGVCTIVRRDFRDKYVEKICEVDWDVEGRFLVFETKATESMPKLALINVYAVNGTDNPYKDPVSGEIVGTRHDRKLRVHRLLQDECRKLEANGFGVVVAGDLNIARSTLDGYPKLRTFPRQHCINRADFEAKFFSCSRPPEPSLKRDRIVEDESLKDDGLGMIDTFRHLHPEKRAYTYYPRTRTFGQSCDRVDLIMISKTLKDHLREAGMHETPGERGPSDHVPLYARLEFDLGHSDDGR